MNSVVHVSMGDIMVSDNKETTLETLVGSCIALCLHDKYKRISGIAHIMLPHNKGATTKEHSPGKYADEAIYTMLKMMEEKGSKSSTIWAKIVGGANMFSHEGGAELFTIGKMNIEAVKGLLNEKKIRLVSEDVGKNYGRMVRIDVETGEIVVSNRTRGEISI